MYFVDWHEWCGTVGLVRATWQLDSCLCFVFRSGYRKKIEFWYDQCSHGQTAFCSYVLGQIALYLQKVICGKNKTSLVHVRLLSGIGSGSSAIFEHKNVHTMYFLIVFKLLFEKRGGGIFGDHNFTLWRPKIYTWSPVGARIKKLISDPETDATCEHPTVMVDVVQQCCVRLYVA